MIVGANDALKNYSAWGIKTSKQTYAVLQCFLKFILFQQVVSYSVLQSFSKRLKHGTVQGK